MKQARPFLVRCQLLLNDFNDLVAVLQFVVFYNVLSFQTILLGVFTLYETPNLMEETILRNIGMQFFLTCF